MANCWNLWIDITIVKSIEEMLYFKYPEAFRKDTENLSLKKEYRGISDIINGMSSGEINLGFWHEDSYWKRDGKLEAEAFAQFGRALYNQKEVVDMMSVLFSNSYREIIETIERMIK